MKEHTTENKYILEKGLLINVAQTRISDLKTKEISDALQKNLDWNYILKIAEQNSLSPLLCWNLLQNFNHLLPNHILEYLNRYSQTHLQCNMTLTKKLIDVVRLFHSNNIPVISFKGPLLALQAYGNLALRQFNDLDILVQPNYLKKAIDLLISNGYVAQNDLKWFERKDWYLSRVKDVVFVDEKGEYILELHWKLSGAHFAYPIESESLWANSNITKLGGEEINGLNINILFLYLCLHGARHGWERMSWICDLNELIYSEKEIDWKMMSQEAKRLGCENILGLGLFLVNNFFGTKVSVPNWNKIQNDEKFRSLAEEIKDRIFEENSSGLDISKRYEYHLKLKERRRDKLKLHLHYQFWYLQLLISPNRLDKETVKLPHWINPIYFLIRPVRLFYNYIIKSNKT